MSLHEVKLIGSAGQMELTVNWKRLRLADMKPLANIQGLHVPKQRWNFSD